MYWYILSTYLYILVHTMITKIFWRKLFCEVLLSETILCVCHVYYGATKLNQGPYMCPAYMTLIWYIQVCTFILCMYKYIPVFTSMYQYIPVQSKYPVLVQLVTIPDYPFLHWQCWQPVPEQWPRWNCCIKCKMKGSHLKLTQSVL